MRIGHHTIAKVSCLFFTILTYLGCTDTPNDVVDTKTDQSFNHSMDRSLLNNDSEISEMDQSLSIDLGREDLFLTDVSPPLSPDMTVVDAGVVCTLEDCGLRVPELVDECSGASNEFLLIGCEPDLDNRCRWVFSECPEDPPCVGTSCEAPCEPWTFFDAGDGCNRCQCGPSMTRLDAYCTQFDCSESGCRDNDDCAQGEYCNFGDNRCGIEGRRGACEPVDMNCDPLGYTCGCDGSYGSDRCALLTQSGADQMPYGGCLIPDLGEAVACGPSVCLGQEFYCRIDIDDPAMPERMNATCEPIPEGCVQGDCSCLVDKLSTHACFNAGGFVVMIQKTPEVND